VTLNPGNRDAAGRRGALPSVTYGAGSEARPRCGPREITPNSSPSVSDPVSGRILRRKAPRPCYAGCGAVSSVPERPCLGSRTAHGAPAKAYVQLRQGSRGVPVSPEIRPIDRSDPRVQRRSLSCVPTPDARRARCRVSGLPATVARLTDESPSGEYARHRAHESSRSLLSLLPSGPDLLQARSLLFTAEA
jgi:hypothetical protein